MKMIGLSGIVLAAGCAATASAQLSAIPVFAGELNEPFGAQSVSFPHCVENGVFAGAAQMCTFNVTSGAPTNSAHTTGSWSFNCSIGVRSPTRLFGIASAGGHAEIVFITPVRRFGAFFGTNSNDALLNGGGTATFLDEASAVIGQAPIPLIICGAWEWHGWESTVPIKTIRLRSNRSTGAHLMIEDMTADPAGGGQCYANCDGSTVEPILNVDDFTCFINEFAAAQTLPHEQQVTHYANCDSSTVAPALNVDDFTCFINEFATGCP